MRETLPGRSATEQLLLSTAADRCVTALPLAGCEGKKVFIQLENLDAFDKPYVQQRLRASVLSAGGRMAEASKDADVVLEVASGALSIDRRDYLVGIPGLPIPIPSVGTFTTPELALFKIVLMKGKAKMLVTAVDPKEHSQLWEMPVEHGRARTNYWWLLFTGPYEWTDVPE